jgi:hypothetical protein
MLANALQSRLKVIEEEILRMARQVSEAREKADQDNRWCMAQDLQRDARELRSQIRKISEAKNEAQDATLQSW